MTEADKPRFWKALKAFLYTLNGTKTPDSDVLAFYWHALETHPLDKVLAALDKAAQTETQHVPPARLVEFVTGKKTEKAKESFAELLKILKRHGVRGAQEHVDHESKGFMVLKTIGGFRVMNENVERAKSEFYAAWENA